MDEIPKLDQNQKIWTKIPKFKKWTKIQKVIKIAKKLNKIDQVWAFLIDFCPLKIKL